MSAWDFVSLFKETLKQWNEDKAPRLGAALAYYTVFSLVPLSIIAISIGGLIFGPQQAEAQLIAQIENWIGVDAAHFVRTMIESARVSNAGVVATVVGLLTLIFGALGWFGQLQDALNTIWEVKPRPGRGLVGLIKDRLLSLAMVLGSGLLLLLSTILSTSLAILYKVVGPLLPAHMLFIESMNLIVSFVLVTFVFALIFKVLPDVQIAWRDVWLGALLTGILFTLGKYLISFYLSNSSIGSVYGAAGSLAALLIWIYYSAQILFFGAEFTQVYAHRRHARIRPLPTAMPVSEEMRAQEGTPHERR